MKLPPVIAVLSCLSVLFIASCSQAPSPQPLALRQADSLSAQDPRRAITMLDSMQAAMQQADSSTWIYYQLLRIKAQDRAYVPHTSDHAILEVIDYYERHPEGDLLAWAYCYGGRVCRDLNDLPRALTYLQKSLDELEDGRNPNLRQRVLSQVGYLFYYQYLFAESRAIRQEVIANDSLLGNYDRVLTSYTDIARCYIAEEKYDSAAYIAHYAHVYARQHQLTRQKGATDLLDAQVSEYRGLHREALRIVEPYLADTTLVDAVPYLQVASRSCMAMGLYDEAESLCHRILDDDHSRPKNRQQAWRHLARISLDRGQSQRATECQARALECIDEVMHQERQAREQLVGDYYHSLKREQQMQRLQREKDRAQQRFFITGFLLVCLLLVALVAWLGVKRRRVEHLLSHERALTAFKSSELCQRIYALYYAQRPVPDELWDEIEDCLNDSFPQFIPRLRVLSTFSETEWHLSLLTRLDFRNVEIATLLCKHKSAISMAKKRLYEKVRRKEGKAEDWDQVISSL